jgi:hypothetical protein
VACSRSYDPSPKPRCRNHVADLLNVPHPRTQRPGCQT